MSKARAPVSRPNSADLRDHYDFSRGVRGKYAARYAEGVTIVMKPETDDPAQERLAKHAHATASIAPPETVGHLKSPEDCERFALNVEAHGKRDLAAAARRRAISLRAANHGATSPAAREALEAVYAYERTLFAKHGKTVRAARTWRMIKERGILPAVEHIVTRNDESRGFEALAEMGLLDMAFEAVVLRHPDEFSDEAVRRSRERLAEQE